MSESPARDIATALADRAESVLSYLFPAGQVIGAEFCVGSLAGEAGKSLKVHLNGSNKGTVWKDFATGEGGGDLLDLWAAARCGGDIKRAMREAREWLGLSDQPPGHTLPVDKPQTEKGHKAGEWIYRDAQGEPWIRVSRYDYANGNKAFFQYDLKAQKPIKAGGHQLPHPRPLYNLDLLQTPGQEVWFVEGEKCAEALKSVGFMATTTIGGASSPHKTDFTPLAGRRVFIWPDNDKPGLKYADKIIDLLQAVGAVYTLIAIPQDKPAKWDAYDAVQEGWGREEVTGLMAPRMTVTGNAALERRTSAVMALSYDYPTHDCLWQGPFLTVAEHIGKFTWPVWLGTYCALMAQVHRRIERDWFGSLLCGMPYAVMVGYSGSDKGLAARICHELIPDDYAKSTGLASGPGLIEILRSNTDKEQEESSTPNLIPSHPAICIIEEWTKLLKYAGLNGATLYEDICQIYHTRTNFDHPTKRRKGEGGNQKLQVPTFSILGTTTPGGFSDRVTKEALTYGFINRHLILPCKNEQPQEPWRSPERLQTSNGYHPLHAYLLEPYIHPPRSWLSGEPVELLFRPDAAEAMAFWIKQNVTDEKNRYLNAEPSLIHLASIPRLDRHVIQIALAYALANTREYVELSDVEAAVWVADTAKIFTQRLVVDRPVTASPLTKQHQELDGLILDKVRERETITKKEVQRLLVRHADFPEIGVRIMKLIEQGILEQYSTHGTRKKLLRLSSEGEE